MRTGQDTDSGQTDSAESCQYCQLDVYRRGDFYFTDAEVMATMWCDGDEKHHLHRPRIPSIWEMYKEQDPWRRAHPVIALLLDLAVGVFLFFVVVMIIGGIGNFVATH